MTIPISTPERKLCPKEIAKARTWRGHSRKMVGGTRSCTGRAWWTGRGWATAFPDRRYSLWKIWRPSPQERCNTSQPSPGSTWMCGAEGYWCLGGWERRRSPSWKEKQSSAHHGASLPNRVTQSVFILYHAYLPKAESVFATFNHINPSC